MRAERNEEKRNGDQRRQTKNEIAGFAAHRFLRDGQKQVRRDGDRCRGDRAARSEAQHPAEDPENEKDHRRLSQIDEDRIKEKVRDVNDQARAISHQKTR